MKYTLENWDIGKMDEDLSTALAEFFTEEQNKIPDIPVDIDEYRKLTYFANLEELVKEEGRDVKDVVIEELGEDFYNAALTQLKESVFNSLREVLLITLFAKNNDLKRAEVKFFTAFILDTYTFEMLKKESPIFKVFADQIHPTRLKAARRGKGMANFGTNYTMVVLIAYTFGLAAIPYIIAKRLKKKRMKNLAKDRLFRQLCYILKESKWLTDAI